MAFKITGLDKVPQRIKQITDIIRKASTLESFYKSPDLALAAGRCVQRTINRQKFKKLNPKYRIARIKKFGDRPILKLTEALYNRALENGFFEITTGDGFRVINIKISDLIAKYQEALGRNLFVPDAELRNDLFNLANKTLAENIDKELKALK